MKKFGFVLSALVLVLALLTVGAFAIEDEGTRLDTSKLEVVYTNGFDDADALKDFTQYMGTWEVKDGRLYLTAATDNHSFILYTGDSALTTLTDYVLDVDMYNTQTQGGPIIRANLDKVVGTSVNGMAGYIGFVGFNGDLGAVGFGREDGGWGGNINVGASGAFAPGSNLHIQLVVQGSKVQCVFTRHGARGRLALDSMRWMISQAALMSATPRLTIWSFPNFRTARPPQPKSK